MDEEVRGASMLHGEIFHAFLVTSVALAVVTTVLYRAKVPTILGFILTGLIIGPSGFNWISSLPAASAISELGVIFLMFSLGLEISLSHLKSLARPLVTVGFPQVFLTTLIGGLGLTLAFDFSIEKSFILGACLALSSTAVVLKLLQESRETESPRGRVSVVILLFQDIVALPLMIAVPFLAGVGATSGIEFEGFAALIGVGKVLAFMGGCFLLGTFLIPRLFREVSRTGSREVFFFSIISMTFVIAFAAEQVDLSMSLGAFVAGVLISESPYSKQALAEFSPLRDIFLGFFFASIGMLIDLPFIRNEWSTLLWLIPALFLIKFLVIYLVVRGNKHSHGVSLSNALSLSQIGEFSFILAASALSHQLISQIEFQYFIALAVASLMFTPALFDLATRACGHHSWPQLTHLFRDPMLSPRQDLTSTSFASEPEPQTPYLKPRKALVIGLGHTGRELMENLSREGIPTVGVDFNLELVTAADRRGLPAIYGDATRLDVLEAAGIRDAYLVVICVNARSAAAQVLALVQSHYPTIETITRLQYLSDMKHVRARPNDEFVIAEAETSHKLVELSLSHYRIV